MLAALGDLVEDIVVRVDDPINVASDTDASVDRRRGGSAANVAAEAARLAGHTRFLGQVGDDAIGRALVAELDLRGVDTSFVRFGGRTGTIVVLVDAAGERSMLTDRGACLSLDRPSERWLDGVTALHVPLYSFVGDPLAGSARQVVRWAHERDVAVSVDVSSAALIERLDPRTVLGLLADLAPSVVFANEVEAAVLGVGEAIGDAITVVKRGPQPVLLFDRAGRREVPTTPIETGADTTGAGDAFAAGFLTAGWADDPVGGCRAGHAAAADVLRRRPP